MFDFLPNGRIGRWLHSHGPVHLVNEGQEIPPFGQGQDAKFQGVIGRVRHGVKSFLSDVGKGWQDQGWRAKMAVCPHPNHNPTTSCVSASLTTSSSIA